jgi:hypothetical protein
MKMKICLAVTLAFFISMIVLTFTARSVHNARLPHVSVKRLTRESYTVYREGSMITYRQISISKTLYDEGEVYTIFSRIVNGEKRDFARKVILRIGQELEDFYEVIDGLLGYELVIFDSDKPLNNGVEVFVVQ